MSEDLETQKGGEEEIEDEGSELGEVIEDVEEIEDEGSKLGDVIDDVEEIEPESTLEKKVK